MEAVLASNTTGNNSGTVRELFSSRWGLLVTAIGIAIGTGNIWRFPRVAAANGGGVFIILWMAFLFLWSIPLLTVESSLGRSTRHGTVGSFAALLGKRGAWMGAFVALTTTGILCYYAVVTGWCMKYFAGSLLGSIGGQTGVEYWHAFAGSGQAVAFHLGAVALCCIIVTAGVRAGIEATAKVFIPVLGLILIYSAVRALMLPGSGAGVSYLFGFDPADFLKPRVYLEALSQSAWSTGAGWGLLLTYSVYARSRERIVENSFIMGMANNAASLLAALAVIPTVFALLPAETAIEVATTPGENSTGMTFIWIPRLLGDGPGGRMMLTLFFLALVLAAMSSMISMVEMAVRNLLDIGVGRKRATLAVGAIIGAVGIPSAMSSGFFDNQDWVWGLGLIVNGLLFCLAVSIYGFEKFRSEMVERHGSGDMHLPRWFGPLIKYVVPAQFALLIGWWFWRSFGWTESWWNPLGTFSIASVIAQWGAALLLALWLGPKLARKLRD
jgi:neurotransmitter:Na+ symporter, NSS family